MAYSQKDRAQIGLIIAFSLLLSMIAGCNLQLSSGEQATESEAKAETVAEPKPDPFVVPKDALAINYGSSSENKYVEIYDVAGSLYMRDQFENDGIDTFYLAQKISSVDNYDMYAVRRVVDGPPGENSYLNSQYLLVDSEKNRVIYKENLDDSVTDNNAENYYPVSILGVAKYG